MEVVKTREVLKDTINRLRSSGKIIGLVPTMGALHTGHISLARLALQHADAVVATIFVNPTQFGPNEDFSKYPRTEAEDVQKLKEAGVAIVYVPVVEEMYKKDAVTTVHVKGISEELCGAFRPGHFDGVATIVTKLFMQAMPDIAVFGEKDYQQLHIIKQFSRDLDVPVRIIGAPITREQDGLAMSSRNRYLNKEERKVAASLYRILCQTAEAVRNGQGIHEAVAHAKASLLSGGFGKVDYVEIRDAETLTPVSEVKKPVRLLAAAHLGTTRLIDNIEV
jgi:pantoate--beta-alanine ligase